MARGIDAQGREALQIHVLDIGRRGFENHLELVIMLQPVGILAIEAVRGPSGWLHIGRPPGLRTDDPKKGGRIEGSGPDLDVVGLDDRASGVGPEALQGQDDVLNMHSVLHGPRRTVRRGSRAPADPETAAGGASRHDGRNVQKFGDFLNAGLEASVFDEGSMLPGKPHVVVTKRSTSGRTLPPRPGTGRARPNPPDRRDARPKKDPGCPGPAGPRYPGRARTGGAQNRPSST
jgi:hypothetical protein